MVFCYKVVTKAADEGVCNRNNDKSMHAQPDWGRLSDDDLLDSIPEREWRLLAAMARRREEDNERAKLSDHLRRMWQEEKQATNMVEAETSEQYRRFVLEKRRKERSYHEHKQNLLHLEKQVKKGLLAESIRLREDKVANLKARKEQMKSTELLNKAIDEEARAFLALDRRARQHLAEDVRRREELTFQEKRVHDARSRKSAMLQCNAQRVAINNALHSWESTLLRQEVMVEEAGRRAASAARVARAEVRGEAVERRRVRSAATARKVAALAQRMRDAVRGDGRL